MSAARDYVASEAVEAKRLLAVLPESPVRTALEQFADVVADRSS
jgi:heptaprenyl diphosphate synthase